jgi:RNA 2',3'-cyclic 3'-phosphodiesterase
VTLCFLGWLEEAAIGSLSQRVESIAREAGAVPGLTLDEGLWLPRRRPRVLAIGLSDGDGALVRLRRSAAQALAAGGWYEPDARPYLPHVTVARVRGTVQPPRRATLPPPPEVAFAGAAVTLYRSRLHPSGARYEPLSRNELA